MFDKEFYPTPVHVLDMMQIDCSGKICYEPHAGKGDIVDYLFERGASRVVASEKNKDLCKIVEKKGELIGSDFFNIKEEDISHVDLIVMNPPFSNAVDHILHAWRIAPEGCEIVSLCNWSSVEKSRYKTEAELQNTINLSGFKQNLGDVFNQAERTTNVSIGLVKLFKPKSDTNEFDGFFDTEDVEESQSNGLIQHNIIREIVNRYVGAVKMFDEVQELSGKINGLSSMLGHQNNISFGAHWKSNERGEITRDVYKRHLQKAAWKTVLSKMNIDKFVTSSVIEDINKFVEVQQQYPFTMRNVYKMIDVIINTVGARMNDSLLKIFEDITSRYHENRYSVEGWKTNKHYLIGKKFILPYITSIGWSGQMDVPHNSRQVSMINDLVKALCYLCGENYDNHNTLSDFMRGSPQPLEYYIDQEPDYSRWFDNLKKDHQLGNENKESFISRMINSDFENKKARLYHDYGKWHDWGFFEIKGFKKGTMHFKFKDEKVWERLNHKIAELKGFPLYEKI